VSLGVLRDELTRAAADAGLEHVPPHQLRHTYATATHTRHSADKIAFRIGDTPQTVRLVYAHMLEASSAPAAAAMDAALEGFDR
jgi:integrase